MFPDLGSQYEFVKELGRGGTGVVNLAYDRHSGFFVAVKSLFDYHVSDNDILRKFKEEANIYLMLDHPNIVTLRNFIIKNETEKGYHNFINLIGIESPGLTASLAIAEFVKDIID